MERSEVYWIFQEKNVPTVFICGLNFVIQNAVLRVSTFFDVL